MHYLVALKLLATAPHDVDALVDAAVLADRLEELAADDPGTIETIFALHRPFEYGAVELVSGPTVWFDATEPAHIVTGRQVPVPTFVGLVDGQPTVIFERREETVTLDLSANGPVLDLHLALQSAGLPPETSGAKAWLLPGADLDWTGTVPTAAGTWVVRPAPHLVLVARVLPLSDEEAEDAMNALNAEAELINQVHASMGSRARRREADRLLGLR